VSILPNSFSFEFECGLKFYVFSSSRSQVVVINALSSQTPQRNVCLSCRTTYRRNMKAHVCFNRCWGTFIALPKHEHHRASHHKDQALHQLDSIILLFVRPLAIHPYWTYPTQALVHHLVSAQTCHEQRNNFRSKM
jgi:hypothetical protein